jgi:hypothetical protein
VNAVLLVIFCILTGVPGLTNTVALFHSLLRSESASHSSHSHLPESQRDSGS